jgi:glycosyltransferase 2 family protein
VAPRGSVRQYGPLAVGRRALPVALIAGAVLGLLALVYHLGAGSIASAVARITWWQFVLICVVHGVSVMADTIGWRYTLARDQQPPFHRLLAARCAGEAVNLLTALGSVGGEAIKAWLLRREIPYEASVPSLILAKTSLVLAQALLLVAGVLVAWTTGIAGSTLLLAMGSLLLVEVIGVGGFLLVQVAGVVGKAGRLLAWAGVKGIRHAQRLDEALRGFYLHEWRSFLLSTALHFVGWLIGALEAFLILKSLGLPASLITATVIEAVGSGVRFATFFVPASLGTLEGSNAAAFTALGWAASAGLAFTLVRRARQVVWIGVGVVILMAMDAPRFLASKRRRPVPSGGLRLFTPAGGARSGRSR